MSIEQGTLFTEVTEVILTASTDPMHSECRVVHRGFQPGPGFPDAIQIKPLDDTEKEPSVEDLPHEAYFFDSHEVLRAIISDISDARKHEGLVNSGANSIPVQWQAEKRGKAVHAVYEDARRRQGDLYKSAQARYEEWINAGAAVIGLTSGVAAAKPHFTQFKDRYYGGKAQDRRRVKLLKRIKN
jgi:hypothetical protein